MMNGWDGGTGGIFMWLFGLLFVAAVVVGIVLLVRSGSHGSAGGSHPMTPGAPAPTLPSASSALQVLEDRYARGEIDREEFLQRRQDLSGGK